MGHIGTFFIVIILLGLIWMSWVFGGGPERADLHTETRSSAAQENNSFSWTKFFQSLKPATITEAPSSFFASSVAIIGAAGARSSDPNREYVEIGASPSNTGSVSISGWSLVSSTGKKLVIGNAAALPMSGSVNQETPITLPPGARMIVTTGRSPIGVSFRENACTGYFEQFQDFYPPLPLACPSASADLSKRNLTSDASCVAFAARTPSCITPHAGFPGELSAACMSYAQTDLTYNGCVSFHQNDFSFFDNVWRVFAGENSEAWNNTGGSIRLYDTDGKLVDSLIY